MSLTQEQLHILQHALGLAQNDRPPAYRNRYVVEPDCDSFDDCRSLVDAGLMVDHGAHRIAGGMHCFSATDEGERIAREAWESAKPKLTRAQRRYRDWLASDCGLSFGEWLAAGRQPA